MTQLTDREILEACARASCTHYNIEEDGIVLFGEPTPSGFRYWNPLAYDCDCARLENRCGVLVDCEHGVTNEYTGPIWYQEIFTPGNDAERRRASCLAVAMAQLAKEAGK